MRNLFVSSLVALGISACSATPQSADQAPTAEEPVDPVVALESGCEAGSAGDCLNLGFRFERGDGVDADADRALALYDRSCTLGSPHACYAQALVLLYDKNDPTLAEHLLDYTCKSDYWPSCIMLGDLYREGFGVIKDEKKALTLYRDACVGGDFNGCNAYNTHLWTASHQLESLENYVSFLGEACNAGHAGSCTELGKLYEDGARWVGFELAADAAKARKYYAEAARLKRLVAPAEPVMLTTKPPAAAPEKDVVDNATGPGFMPGNLSVSGPEGQEIIVDGIATGTKAPGRVLVLTPGRHRVQLRSEEGTLTHGIDIFVESGSNIELTF